MGVRGLTTYIAQHADRYLDPYELADCNLVIDGDSLSSNLYKWVSNCNSAFGGNYDQYYRTICDFFAKLKQCNVTAYVLLDGGYQLKKMNTVRQRLRSKIGAIKYLNPFDAKPMFPIMMREVFVEALQHCQVHLMRCIFEADDEVAALARKLNCPVLSYDSDFYIHNVMYIPWVKLSTRVYRRSSKQMAKKSSAFFMKCSLYRIENLIRDRRLRAEMLPLFAVLLGNDYVNSSIFKKFYSNVSMKRTGKNNTQQGKRIVALLRWLQNETLETAIAKIIGYTEKERKEWLHSQIEIAMSGYSHERSEAFDFFGFSEDDFPVSASVVCPSISNDVECKSVDCDEQETDSETSDDSDTESVDSQIKENAPDSDIECSKENKQCEITLSECELPDWLKQKILKANLPRFVIDLIYLRLFVNAPQVENFLLPDCHLIAIDILRLIFTILHLPNKPELRYLTRVQRRTDIEYKRYQCFDDDIHFDTSDDRDNFTTFKYIFREINESEQLFETIEKTVPAKLQLFYLSIVYWSKRSEHLNIVHISSLIICYIVLSVIDPRLTPFRDREKFERLCRPQDAKQRLTQKKLKQGANEPPANSLKTIKNCLDTVNKDECIVAQSNLMDLFEVSGKLREKHTEFSSNILHGFAEFQSIAYQMNCLNTLCDERLQNIQISNHYNGCFLYNVYVALKERPNIRYYIQNFLFPNSPHLFQLYETMMAVLIPFVPCLSNETISKRRKNKNINKKKSRELKKGTAAPAVEPTADTVAGDESSDYEDLNNKFACLLRT